MSIATEIATTKGTARKKNEQSSTQLESPKTALSLTMETEMTRVDRIEKESQIEGVCNHVCKGVKAVEEEEWAVAVTKWGVSVRRNAIWNALQVVVGRMEIEEEDQMKIEKTTEEGPIEGVCNHVWIVVKMVMTEG